MHLLQRVHTSRSIGFSCSHSTSKAPSHPETRSGFPDHTGKLRSAEARRHSMRDQDIGSENARQASRHSRAATEGPMTRTGRRICTRRWAPARARAAPRRPAARRFRRRLPAFRDQPPSPDVDEAQLGLGPRRSASSPNSGASCVQPPGATRRERRLELPGLLTAQLRVERDRAAVFQGRAEGFASSGIVLLQLQSFKRLVFYRHGSRPVQPPLLPLQVFLLLLRDHSVCGRARAAQQLLVIGSAFV